MSAARGVLGGVLGLSLLQAFTSNPGAAGGVGTLFKIATAIVDRLMNPTVALIPDLR